MGFEEIREQLNYLHKRRDLSKRKNRFIEQDDKENISSNISQSGSGNKGSPRSQSKSLESKKSKRVSVYFLQSALN
jgi:hypothetical protein